ADLLGGTGAARSRDPDHPAAVAASAPAADVADVALCAAGPAEPQGSPDRSAALSCGASVRRRRTRHCRCRLSARFCLTPVLCPAPAAGPRHHAGGVPGALPIWHDAGPFSGGGGSSAPWGLAHLPTPDGHDPSGAAGCLAARTTPPERRTSPG